MSGNHGERIVLLGAIFAVPIPNRMVLAFVHKAHRRTHAHMAGERASHDAVGHLFIAGAHITHGMGRRRGMGDAIGR